MDWSQYRHHCIWLTLRIREDTVVSSVFQLGVSMPSTTVFSDLEPVAGWCRYVSFHRDLQASIDRHFSDLDVNIETFVLFLSACSSTFLSAWETWICRLLPTLHAHLPCMILLSSEECALLEKKKKTSLKRRLCFHILYVPVIKYH